MSMDMRTPEQLEAARLLAKQGQDKYFAHRREAQKLTSEESARLGVQAAKDEEWAKLLNRDDVVILDTETTGLDENAEIVEIALLNTNGKEVFEEVFMPQDEVPEGAAKVHGLDRTKLREMGAQPWSERHAEVKAALEAATTVLVWNADYDTRLLRQTCERWGFEMPQIKEVRCMMAEYSTVGRHQRLQYTFNRHCGESVQTHRAMGDCQMVLAVMREATK